MEVTKMQTLILSILTKMQRSRAVSWLVKVEVRMVPTANDSHGVSFAVVAATWPSTTRPTAWWRSTRPRSKLCFLNTDGCPRRSAKAEILDVDGDRLRLLAHVAADAC